MRLHPPHDHSHEPEHPVVAWVGVAAIVVAVLLIIWARFEVRGTAELDAAFSGQDQIKPPPKPKIPEEGGKSREAESAAAKSRWATGFSH